MAQAAAKTKVMKDAYTPDGVRMFNISKPHGVVYADGFTEVKYIQEHDGREMHYRGDGTPVGYVMGKPLPKPIDEVENENTELRARIAEMEASQARMLAMLEQLTSQRTPPAQTPPPADAPPKQEAAKAPETSSSGKPRTTASKK